jgi:hypothetical protein
VTKKHRRVRCKKCHELFATLGKCMRCGRWLCDACFWPDGKHVGNVCDDCRNGVVTFGIKRGQVTRVDRYICSVCNTEHETFDEARACANRGFPVINVKIGDIIYTDDHITGWYDGDKRWVKREWKQGRPEQEDHLDFGYDYYLVVVDVQPGEYSKHGMDVHAVTNAMTGKMGWRRQLFVARADGDCRVMPFFVAKHVPKVVREGAKKILADWAKGTDPAQEPFSWEEKQRRKRRGKR